jgi:hypothetical protein
LRPSSAWRPTRASSQARAQIASILRTSLRGFHMHVGRKRKNRATVDLTRFHGRFNRRAGKGRPPLEVGRCGPQEQAIGKKAAVA